ncbi:hypothetical protein [Cryobacterium sp. Y29]|nr:hypothetical protein [Cryobacterium sp. Y29]
MTVLFSVLAPANGKENIGAKISEAKVSNPARNAMIGRNPR